MRSRRVYPPLQYRYDRRVFTFLGLAMLVCIILLAAYLSPTRSGWFYIKLILLLLISAYFVYFTMKGLIPAFKKAPILTIDDTGIFDGDAGRFIPWTCIWNISHRVHENADGVKFHRLVIEIEAGADIGKKDTDISEIKINTTYLTAPSSEICDAARAYFVHYKIHRNRQKGKPLS